MEKKHGKFHSESHQTCSIQRFRWFIPAKKPEVLRSSFHWILRFVLEIVVLLTSPSLNTSENPLKTRWQVKMENGDMSCLREHPRNLMNRYPNRRCLKQIFKKYLSTPIIHKEKWWENLWNGGPSTSNPIYTLYSGYVNWVPIPFWRAPTGGLNS